VLLDTDILSEIIKKKDATVAARATSYLSDEGRFTVSVLSVMEIVYGFHRLGREDRLEQFRTLISAHEVLPFEMTTATLAGRIYADLERQGTPVGLAGLARRRDERRRCAASRLAHRHRQHQALHIRSGRRASAGNPELEGEPDGGLNRRRIVGNVAQRRRTA
jgi:predicted nucleic acid-binding protein